MGRNVQDLPEILGIGRASLFCYRTGKRTITRKTWLKLEQAERAADIHQDSAAAGAAIADNEANPKDSAPAPGEKVSAVDDPLRSVQAQLAAIQARLDASFSPVHKIVAEFPLNELILHMQAAGAWPHSQADGKLSPAQLWQKYAPPAGTPSQPPILAPGVRKRDLENY